MSLYVDLLQKDLFAIFLFKFFIVDLLPDCVKEATGQTIGNPARRPANWSECLF